MKALFAPVLLTLLCAAALPVVAQNHAANHAAPPAKVPMADGTVRKIDKVNQRVTLAHGPLPNGMPGMTMAFRVKDPAWLDRMKEGQKIRFATEEIKGELTVVRFEPAA
jgi:Cu/Ag efflux protein CusF